MKLTPEVEQMLKNLTNLPPKTEANMEETIEFLNLDYEREMLVRTMCKSIFVQGQQVAVDAIKEVLLKK